MSDRAGVTMSKERTEREAMAACYFEEVVTVEMLDGWMRDAQQGQSDCEAQNEVFGEEALQARHDILGLYMIIRHLVKYIDFECAAVKSAPEYGVVENARRVILGGDLSVTFPKKP